MSLSALSHRRVLCTLESRLLELHLVMEARGHAVEPHYITSLYIIIDATEALTATIQISVVVL